MRLEEEKPKATRSCGFGACAILLPSGTVKGWLRK